MHYARWRKYGTPQAEVRSYTKQSGTCRGADCDRPAARKGCCQAHYARWLKEGDASLLRPVIKPVRGRCSVAGCDRPHRAKGHCEAHYQRWLKQGDPGPAELQEKSPRAEVCQGPDCSSPVRAKGYCPAHYRQWREGGPLVPKKSFAPAGSGYLTAGGYRAISVAGRRGIFEHRHYVELLLDRRLLHTETVHHVNGVRTDNSTDGPLVMDERGRLRSGNLELWSHAHPYGQEIGPKLDYARSLLALYGTPEEQSRYATFEQVISADPGDSEKTDG